MTKTTDSFSRGGAYLVSSPLLGGPDCLAAHSGSCRSHDGANAVTCDRNVCCGPGEYGQRLDPGIVRASGTNSVTILGVFDRRHGHAYRGKSKAFRCAAGIPENSLGLCAPEPLSDEDLSSRHFALADRGGEFDGTGLQSLKKTPQTNCWKLVSGEPCLPASRAQSFFPKTSAGVPSIANIFERPITGPELVLKTIEDRVGALIMLVHALTIAGRLDCHS